MARPRRTTKRDAPDRKPKKKVSILDTEGITWVDYKDVPMLRKYMSDRGKIRSRRVTGNCAQHQRALAQAIKTARELVLLPYTQRTVTERPVSTSVTRSRVPNGNVRWAAVNSFLSNFSPLAVCGSWL